MDFVVQVSACIVEFPSMARHTHMNPHDRVRGVSGPFFVSYRHTDMNPHDRLRDSTGTIFCFLPVLTFCVTYYQPVTGPKSSESVSGPKSSELLTY